MVVCGANTQLNLHSKPFSKTNIRAVSDVNELLRKCEYVGYRKGSFVVDLLHDLGFDKEKIRAYEHP